MVSVNGNYTDLGGPKMAEFLCGHGDLQLESPHALPYGLGCGGRTVTRADYFKDHRSGRKQRGSVSWILAVRADLCRQRPPAPHQPQLCMQETGERRWGQHVS